MAEQVGHNVVNHLESTSGSPLVDVAANQTTNDSAEFGLYTPKTSTDSPNQHFEPSKSAHESGTPVDDSVFDGQTEARATRIAAEPSAGDVVGGVAKESATLGSTHDDHEDTSIGDGHPDDRSVADVSVDFSVNSDTDTSRADAAEKKGRGTRMRTNSVKKPATFSKVSVTKNFLAKTATAAPAAPKPGDKVATTSVILQPTAKPRLVAKSAGSSLRDLQKARVGKDGAGGPDASKVWNKNQPVQPPPPRHFTDEELKQQYGIHLATRLQTDESGKESKWADIDDDEDDWAPETVVWMDGTKSTLAPQDPVPVENEQKPAAKPAQKSADAAVKPTLTSMKRSDQTMTILKPGAAAGSMKQNGPTASLPGADKPSLKAKGSLAIPPTKSPWAAVPKIESVSPVNPPVQPPPMRQQMATQDARAYESAPAPHAREIAADTFDRSWKEGEGGTRELFNSTNGRYEPAPDGRRNSFRQDLNTRKPAVLQRPLQSGVTAVDPPSALQNRANPQLDGMWGRRRGSSVSQGSLPPARRLSTNTRASDLPTAIESAAADEGLAQPPAAESDARIDSGRPDFTQKSAWDQQMPPQPVDANEAPPTPMEDAVKLQDRVMREKRELAIKRRQEEEAREEAAKQERLKAKLAALADAGKSRKEREAEEAATAAAAVTVATVGASPSVKPAGKQASEPGHGEAAEQRSEPAKSTPASAVVAPAAEAQQIPTAPGQPTVKSASPPQKESLSSPSPSQPPPVTMPERPVSSSDLTQRQTQRAHMSPRSNARAPYQPPQAAYKGPASSYSSPGERKTHLYGRSPIPNDSAFTSWPTTAPSGNVWGTAGIGNGTFESTSTFAPVPMSQQSSSLPPPPGMGRPATSTRISPQGFAQDSRSPGMQQSQSSEQQQRAFPPPGIESRPDPFGTSTRLAGVSPVPGLSRSAHPPGPIGPPSRSQQPQQPPSTGQRSDPIAMWTQAAQKLPAQFTTEAQAAYERRKNETFAGEPPKRTFKETFKQTAADPAQLNDVKRYQSETYPAQNGQGMGPESSRSPAPPNVQTQPVGPFSTSTSMTDSWKHQGANNVRIPDSSQGAAQAHLLPQQPPIGPPNVQQPLASAYQAVKFTAAPLPPALQIKDSIPPPPETENHPVNSSDYSHPLVKLPPPQAKVKLPPKMTQVRFPPTSPATSAQASVHSSSVMMPQRSFPTWGPPGVAKPIVMNEDWQARFNGLFNRTPIQTETPPSPPKTPPKMQGPALAVASSSRTLLDHQAHVRTGGATVSLPQTRKSLTSEGFVVDESRDVFSKPTIDHVFNEELSFGSMPKIRIPYHAAYNAAAYPPHARNMLSMSSNSKFMKSVDSQSLPEFERASFYKHKDGIFVKIPGTRFNNKLMRHDHAGSLHTGGHRASVSNEKRHTTRLSNKPRAHKDNAQSTPSSHTAPRKVTEFTAGPAAAATSPSDDHHPTDRRRSHATRSNRGGAHRNSHYPSPSHPAPGAAAKSS